VATRLELIEQLKLNYEIPYVSDKGEIVDSTTVTINEHRQGVSISYILCQSTEEKLNLLFPAEGVDHLVQLIKKILQDLEIKPANIILQIWEYSPVNRLYSVEGRAPVNKQRDTVLLILTKAPFVYKFGYELVLWHQAMHAKDRWEYRFPSTHPLLEAAEWLDVLWHFSIDGRLERLAKPHYSKAERLEEAIRILPGLQPQVRELGDELWGKEVTLTQLLEIGKGLGLELPIL